MDKRIKEALSIARSAQSASGAYNYLPDIVELLETLQGNLHGDEQVQRDIARALGRLVSDDLAFSKSTIGQELLSIANDVGNLSKDEA